MRVFISSTVYDLIDIRAELSEHLKNMGITPVISDDKLSDFRVQHDVNSIETCLVNVESCDEVILILDQRYGPTLEKSGYEAVSATHLEYQRAKEKNIPVRVFVRDRLEADFTIWKRNGSVVKKLSWVKDQKDWKLFEILDDHKKLDADATTSNWYFTFTSSIDLKAAITKHFEKRILPERLAQEIHNNNFPLFDIKVDSPLETNQTKIVVQVNLTNISRVPAFNFNVYWEECGDKQPKDNAIISSGQSIPMTFIWTIDSPPEVEKFLISKYESPIGISVRERFRITARIDTLGVISGGSLVDRKFRRSSGISFVIEENY
jgi:hypothetical protein